jgi:putative transposase
MPRRPRIVFPGIAYHITQRGNDRQPVFLSPGDYRFYLDLLARHSARSGLHVLGYCLMPNHVHLVAVPERLDSLARALGHAHSEYALAHNRAYGHSGHLWQNRFFACPMDELHLMSALRYADLNPVRAGLARQPWDWPWSSARAHAAEGVRDPSLDPHWAEYCGRWDRAEWREILCAATEDGAAAAIRTATSTGAPLGSPEFLKRLESSAGKRLKILSPGRPRRNAKGNAHSGRPGESGTLAALAKAS